MLTAKEAKEMSAKTGANHMVNSETAAVLDKISEKIEDAAEKGRSFIVYDFYSDKLSQEERIFVIVSLHQEGYEVHRLDYPAQIWIRW